MNTDTREPQYQRDVDLANKHGLATLGLMTNQAWHDDPKHLLFTAARYKFVAKMLAGRKKVLEVGCADAFFTRIVMQEVGALVATDFDQTFVDDVIGRNGEKWPVVCQQHDLLAGPFPDKFDAAYALDVLEHITPEDENKFLGNIINSLTADGVLILGSPSVESQPYASKQSKEGHVNCKTGTEFKSVLETFFHNVFLFSMNDEVVHTGYAPMAHYRLAIGCTLKK
jgi:cyclopropane fatty-acyl-phospholipid synthase-like methyltransferase